MKTILVPTDFSVASRNATIYAVEFAKATHCKIILYHAFYIPVAIVGEMPIMLAEDADIFRVESLNHLKNEAAELGKNSSVEIECITTEGFVVDEVMNLEKIKKPDYILMGMKVSGSFNERVLGSVATDIIRKTKTPVIIVPEKAKYTTIEKMAFACDYKMGTNTQILKPIKDFVKMFNSQLYVLTILKEGESLESDKILTGITVDNYFADVKHVYHFPEDNDFMHGINEYISKNNINMVSILPHKHTLLEKILGESYTKKLAFHTMVPMLVLPVQESE